jgi:hypothetical protein
MNIRVLWFGLIFGLAACDRTPQPVDTTLPTQNASTAAAPSANTAQAAAKPPSPDTSFPCMGADCRILTPNGWAGIRAGMSVGAAMKASGFSLKRPGHYDEFFADEPDRLTACNMYTLRGAPANLSIFVEEGVVTSIGVGQEEGRGARFVTDKGVGLGDPEAAVRRAYPKLEQEPDIYSEPPDKKLFFRGPKGRGIKFSIVGGRVTGIDVGGRSINYVEGCL